MDESKAELLQLIYTRIGMIMEDASLIALELGAPGSQFAPDRIAVLERSMKAIAALAKAARLSEK